VIISTLIYPAKSETRNAARLASSWCSPTRLSGTLLLKSNFCASSPGNSLSQAPLVGNGPGAMALFRITYLPHSAANDLVQLTTPPLATAEGTTYPEPVNA